MRKLRSILLAADLRSTNSEVAPVAIRLALAAGAHVSLLHVLEPIGHWSVVTPSLQRVSEKVLQDFTSRFTAQQVELAESTTVVGPVVDTIVQKANALNADLILIGAGEQFRFDRFAVGPIATSVIEHAPQPVLAIRPGTPALNFQKILCPVDHSPTSARGLRNAILLAQMFGGELVVLSVIPEISWWTAAVETGELEDSQAAHASQWRGEFEQFLTQFHFDNVPVTKEVICGAPHHQIARAAKDHQADLIVMGATGRTGLARVLVGSTTRRMLAELPCSLLTVKQDDVVEELYGNLLRDMNTLLVETRDLLAAGAFEAAIPKLRQILNFNPFHLTTIEALAEAHEKLGQTEAAELFRRRADQLRPQSSLSLRS